MHISNKKLISSTLERHILSCIEEYESIKNKTNKHFKTVKEWCKTRGFSRQNFLKIYNRYKQNPVSTSLVPQKRGPRFSTRRIDLSIENKVIEYRKRLLNRQTIASILRDEGIIISDGTIYNILKRHNLNRLKKMDKPEKHEKKSFVVSREDKLFHIDLHQLSKGITIENSNQTYYLVGVLDAFSRAV